MRIGFLLVRQHGVGVQPAAVPLPTANPMEMEK